MLDTIVLTLDRQKFEVREPGRFAPSAEGLLVPPYYRLGALVISPVSRTRRAPISMRAAIYLA
jgi:hypothetical protein